MKSITFKRQFAIHLVLFTSILIGLANPNMAAAEGLSGWLKDRATKITKGVKDTVEKVIDEKSTGNEGKAPNSVGNSELNKGEVRELQARLNALGYTVGTPDGVAGQKTNQAIQQFEQEQGLPITGSPSMLVLSSLRNQSTSDTNKTANSANSNNSRSSGGVLVPTKVQVGAETNQTASSTKSNSSGGVLAPTKVQVGTANTNVAGGLGRVEEKVIVPGDDFFKPITGLTLNGLPLIFNDRKVRNQRAYLRAIGLKVLQGGKYVSPAAYGKMSLEDSSIFDEMHADQSKEYGKCIGEPGHRVCEFHGSMLLAISEGEKANEFKQKKLMEKFEKEVISRFTSRISPSAKTFYLVNNAGLGKYDFDANQMRVSLSNLDDWGYEYDYNISISPQDAERAKSFDKTKKALLKFTLDANGVPRTEEVNIYADDSYEKLILTIPVLSKEEAKENRAAKKADKSRQVAAKKQATQQQQAQKTAVEKEAFIKNFPQQNLNVLGIKLGMSPSMAKEILTKAGFNFKGPQRVLGVSKSAFSRTPCEVRRDQAEEIRKAKEIKVDKNSTVYDDCPTKVYKLSFAAYKDYTSSLKDKVAIIVSGNPGGSNKIIAIVRELRDRNREVDFNAKLAENLGDTFVKSGSSKSSAQAWFDSGEYHYRAAHDSKFLKNCTPPHLGYGFTSECGNVLVSPYNNDRNRHFMYLVDTAAYFKSKVAKDELVEKQKAKQPEVLF